MYKILILPFLLLSIVLKAQTTIPDSLRNHELDMIKIIGNKSKSLSGAGQYINNMKLEKLNQINVNNVLRTVAGVSIRDEEGFGLRPNIGLRGTAVNRSAKITLMEDGILIAPAPYSDPSAYYFPTFLRMQGVEVLKGSSQIKYGPYTIGGAVNLISTAIPETFKGFASLSFGSFNTNNQRFWIGDNRKNLDYIFEVNRLASDGFKQLDNGNNTGFDRRDVMAKVRWHTQPNVTMPQSVSLKLLHSSEQSNETYLGLTYNDFKENPYRRYSGTQKDLLEISHQHITLNHTIFITKKWIINTTAYYSNTFRNWSRANSFGGVSISNILNKTEENTTAYNIMTGKSNGSIDYNAADRTFISKGIQMNSTYYFYTNNVNHKIHFGIRSHKDQADRYATKSVYDMQNGVMILNTAGVKGNQENQIKKASSLAAFLSYELQLNKLKLNPGIRYENIQFDFVNYGTNDYARQGVDVKKANNQLRVFLPGLGFNYALNDFMSFYGGIHKGFSPPGMPSINTTNNQAKEENSLNYELGYNIETNGVKAQITGFINQYKNILGSDNVSGGGNGSGEMFNAGNANIHGLELSMNMDLLYKNGTNNNTKLPLSIAYTFTKANFLETFVNGGGDWGNNIINKGDNIPFITPHILTASLGYEKYNFNTNITARYTGVTRVIPGQSSIILPSYDNGLAKINAISSFLICDLSSNYKFNDTLTLFMLINNIANSKAIVSNLPQGYRPNIARSISAGLKIYL